MSEKGYPKDLEQCRTKIKNLKKEYKTVKDNNGETGRGRKTSRYYDMLDSILGHRPASVPHNLLDSHSEVEEPAESERNGIVTLSIHASLLTFFAFPDVIPESPVIEEAARDDSETVPTALDDSETVTGDEEGMLVSKSW